VLPPDPLLLPEHAVTPTVAASTAARHKLLIFRDLRRKSTGTLPHRPAAGSQARQSRPVHPRQTQPSHPRRGSALALPRGRAVARRPRTPDRPIGSRCRPAGPSCRRSTAGPAASPRSRDER
jgi:hypothetical protein